MKSSQLPILAITALALSQPLSATAQELDWVARCRLVLADDNMPESGRYFFQTRGHVAGAPARAELNYSTGVSARAAVYPTEEKDLLNPYSNLSMSIGHFTNGDGKSKPTVGAVSFRAVGKGFKAIPGAPITMKLVIDGVSFGPFAPAPDSSGMYSIWLDTANTDGDGKPPMLSAAEFAKLATAIDTMKSAELVLVRNGGDLVRATISSPQFVAWRDGLAGWAAKTNPSVGAAASCSGGGEILH